VAKILDCRGLPCPQPVMQTKKAMAEGKMVTTIVDNDAAKMNVSRMASKEGYAVEVEDRDDGIYLHMSKAVAVPEEAVAPALVREASAGPTARGNPARDRPSEDQPGRSTGEDRPDRGGVEPH